MRAAEKNPEERRDERDPGCDQGAESCSENLGNLSRPVPSAHEADELQNHDEGTGCRLRETEAIHHLAGLKPFVMVDRVLGDVRQDGVGAAKSDDSSFAE